jgi:hypothetical protein
MDSGLILRALNDFEKFTNGDGIDRDCDLIRIAQLCVEAVYGTDIRNQPLPSSLFPEIAREGYRFLYLRYKTRFERFRESIAQDLEAFS